MYGRDTLKKALDFLSRTKDKYPFDKIISRYYQLEEIDKAFDEQDKGMSSMSAIVL
jgi:Zn-dependent alcohol dehydrogenase